MSKLNYKLVNFCEFDSYATKSYCAIHNVDESLNLGDITKVDETKLESFNMICGGSPCQDFSLAGKRNGSVWTCKECEHEYNPLTVHWSKRDKCPHCNSNNIDKTRSSLLVEYLRIIRANKPNFGIYENVKNIVGKQFKETTFKLFEEELHEYGYNTYWKVLNSKDYGIPQSRERVYLIFIKKELDNGKFVFPKGFNNGIRLKDVLEDEVDEKFYLTDSNIKTYSREFGSKGKQLDLNGISPTLTASMGTGGGNMPYFESKTSKRLRKITPKECFFLMGFSEDNYNAASKVVSNSQLYKQAGNSIVVDVLYYILVELYTAMPYLFDDLRLSSFFSGIGAFEVALDRLCKNIENNEVKLTNNGCVDCDECLHRSEDCLCDISNNDDDCPLLYKNKSNTVYFKKFIAKENRYIAFCNNCDNSVSSIDNFCSCCGAELNWKED